MKKRYDSYKPSGIDWIGDIPTHWTLSKIKFIGEIRGRIGFRGYTTADLVSEGEGALTIGGKHISNNVIDLTDPEYISWDKYYESPEIMVSKGDIVIAQRGTLKRTAYISKNIGPATINPSLVLLTNIKINPKYLHSYLCSNATTEFIDYLNTATAVPMISQNQIEHIRIIEPPLAEQEAIAAWLDEKCGEIDAAIAKVDREIELIDELKQSEISRVVTRGLNPDTPLRPSGIDWIGDVPEHWVNTRIKFNILRSAAGVWGDDEKGDENDIVCFRIADFDYDERCLSTEKITIRNIESKQLEGRYLSKGDLLIEKSGGGESTPVGRVVYCNYNGKATYTNFIHSITLSDSVDSRFFLYYFNMLYSNKVNLLFFNQTTGLQNLQVSDYLGQSICLPPLSEQQAIADYLDKKCAEIDGLKAKLSKKRETLTELRQSIISEVVTGKRKVI